MWPGERAARRKRRENEKYLSRQIHPQSTLHNRKRRRRRRSALNELFRPHIFLFAGDTRFAWTRADKMPPATRRIHTQSERHTHSKLLFAKRII